MLNELNIPLGIVTSINGRLAARGLAGIGVSFPGTGWFQPENLVDISRVLQNDRTPQRSRVCFGWHRSSASVPILCASEKDDSQEFQMNASSRFRPGTLGKGVAGFGIAAMLVMSAATAQVTSGTTGIDATGNAASEMAACNNGKTQQDRETCMREVRNANADKRSGKLDNAGGQFDSNAAQRCNVLTGEEKIACEARVVGVGNTQGSVAGGGVIREVETVVVPKDGTPVNVQPQTASDTIVVIPASK